MTSTEANEAVQELLWFSYRTAGQGDMTEGYRALACAVVMCLYMDMGADAWVILNVRNQLRML